MKFALSKSGALMGCASSLTLLASLFASQQAVAHGYMNEPPSRAYACRLALNTNCGPAEYEPQTVGEAPKEAPINLPQPRSKLKIPLNLALLTAKYPVRATLASLSAHFSVLRA